ncbi:YfhO family protein, partial [bacterium]|nr:YfhO family protein [bacterium]
MLAKMRNMSREDWLKLLLPPIITASFMLIIFASCGMYPFGDLSIVKSDGTRQFIPLLADFKDILEGKSSIFLNQQVSGGINFYGIYLYYLSSPFNFLVKFVDKNKLFGFFNILLMLKMIVISFSATYCLTILHKKLNVFWTVLFSLTYAFCGYTVIYYFIISWIDLLYMFPLLVVGLERIVQERKPLTYIVVLAISCFLSYYITYMFAVFTLLFMGGYLLLNYRERYISSICRQILLSSLLAFLIASVFWLPSLEQYKCSARGEETTVQAIKRSDLFFHKYYESLPLLMAQTLPLIIILGDLIKRRQRSKTHNLYLFLLALTILPFIFEPINLLWHTGNYASFPCRFAFIPIFLSILSCAHTLEQVEEEKTLKYDNKLILYVVNTLPTLFFICIALLVFKFLNINDVVLELSKFSVSTSGNIQAFRYISYLFITTFALSSIVYWAYRRS